MIDRVNTVFLIGIVLIVIVIVVQYSTDVIVDWRWSEIQIEKYR